MNKKSIVRLFLRILVFGMIIFGITSAANAADTVDGDAAVSEPAASAVSTAGIKSGVTGAEGDNLTWTLDSDGVLTISGTGAMADHQWDITWANERGYVKKVIIEEGVTSVGAYAFRYEENLTYVELPSTITSIDKYAFYSCGALQEIDFPQSLKTIDEYAFQWCESLTKIALPAGMALIGEAAFQACTDLKTAVFAGDVQEIDPSAFYGSLGNLTFYGLSKGNISDHADYNYIPFVLITDQKVTGLYLGRNLGETYATLTWKPVDFADGYKIYRYDASAKKYKLLKTTAARANTYKVTGLKAGTVYQYKVVSFVKIAGKDYDGISSVLKFRTKTSAANIKTKNTKISNGFGAAVKTVTNAYSGLDAYTRHNYSSYSAAPSDICQFTDNKGNYCVAYANKSYTYIFIRAYNTDMKQMYYRKIKQLYPLLGSVACDDKGNFYVVWGKQDKNEKPGAVTLAVTKYDKAGKLIKTVKFKSQYSSSVQHPFRSGNCDIAINGNLLYCNYSKGRYDGHQSNANFGLEMDTMTVVYPYYNYVSHAFDQRVLFDKDGRAWFVNHGDGSPRAFEVESRIDDQVAEYMPFHFYAPESAWDDMWVLNRTNANLGGVVETSSGLVLVGSSVKSLQKSGYNSQKKNLFVMYADTSKQMLDGVIRSGYCLGEKVTDKGVKWLTSYTGQDVQNPQVVMTNDDKIVILWETSKNDVYQNTYYMILSSNGKKLQNATKIPGVKLNANEEPVFKDGYVYWSTCQNGNMSSNKLKIHRLNLNVLNFDKTSLAVAGLKVSAKTKNSVTLKWNKNTKANGYYIYKYNTSTKKYTKLATVKAGTLTKTVKKLKKKTNYTFAVQAYKKVGKTTYKGNYKTIKVKTK